MPSFAFSDEQQQLIQTARDFARQEIVPVAGKLDEEGTFPKEICQKGWETGLMNCEIPEAYGGLGLTCLSHCLVLEEISYGCTGVNTTLAGNSLGVMPIIIAGTEEQKKKYFGRLLAAPIFAAYCCSEPDAGQRRRRHEDQLSQGRRRLRAQRAEALDHQRRRRRLLHRLRARRGHAAAQGDHLLRRRPQDAGRAASARRRTRWGSAAPTPPT